VRRQGAIFAALIEIAQSRSRRATRETLIGAQLQGDIRMLDLILIALGLGFFAGSIAYVYACDRL
jgi:hypothetical protein